MITAEQLDALLPQTQCTRCGYPDCRAYARAITDQQAPINQCPPGGAEGIRRLAALTGRPVIPLNPDHGTEGPLKLAIIDEDWCIGCTLCIQACPVDCIVGAPKQMHTVIADQCTGCELCVPVCPVDCIAMQEVTPGRSGWAAWGPEQAQQARERYAFHQFRLRREQQDNEQRLAAKAERKREDIKRDASPEADRKLAVIEAALRRARERLATGEAPSPPAATKK